MSGLRLTLPDIATATARIFRTKKVPPGMWM
jgi:hypothetical protein